MQFDTRSFGTDLFILPETEEDKAALQEWHKSFGGNFKLLPFRSPVEGQSWYGKLCFEIPFGKELRESIEKYVTQYWGVKITGESE